MAALLVVQFHGVAPSIKVEEEDVPQALVVKGKAEGEEVPQALQLSNLLCQRHTKNLES